HVETVHLGGTGPGDGRGRGTAARSEVEDGGPRPDEVDGRPHAHLGVGRVEEHAFDVRGAPVVGREVAVVEPPLDAGPCRRGRRTSHGRPGTTRGSTGRCGTCWPPAAGPGWRGRRGPRR